MPAGRPILGSLTAGLILAGAVAGLGLATDVEAQGYRQTASVIAVERRVAVPHRNSRWHGPPRGARRVYGRYFDANWRWKLDPHTRTVFLITPSRDLWFLDPTSGWAYTIDRWGRVYCADPGSRWVYFLSYVHHWNGDVPYFFNYWQPHAGYYHVPRYDSFAYYYRSSRYDWYPYRSAYDRLWSSFGGWYYSPSFVRVTSFSYYDPYYIRWNGYLRDTYVDSRGYYWWEPDPVSLWRRPNLYRTVTVVRPVYSVRPWERGLPESARLSSERLAQEMGTTRGRDYGPQNRGPTVGFNVPLQDPGAPSFDYGNRVVETPHERTLPQFADPSRPVETILAAAPVELPAGGRLEPLPVIESPRTAPAPDPSPRDKPRYDQPGTIGSPTVIEGPRGIDPGWGDPRGVDRGGGSQWRPDDSRPQGNPYETLRGVEPREEQVAPPAYEDKPRYGRERVIEPQYVPADPTPRGFQQPEYRQPEPAPAPVFRDPEPVYQRPEPVYQAPARVPEFRQPEYRAPEAPPSYSPPAYEPPSRGREDRYEAPRFEAPPRLESPEPRRREIDNFRSDEETQPR